METGSLWVAATLAGKAGPQAGVRVTVFDEAGLVVFRQETDAEGVARVGALPAPDPALSLAPNPAARPYAVYSLLAECEGWQPLRMFGIQLFAGQRTVARIALLPAAAALDTATLRAESEITIPPHPLYAGGGGSGPAPAAGARDPAQHHGASGPPGRKCPQRHSPLPGLYRQRRFQRSVSHLARRGA